MTEYLNKSFSVYPGKDGGQQYRDNWDAVFAKKAEPIESDLLCNCSEEQFESGGHHEDCRLMLTPPTVTVTSVP